VTAVTLDLKERLARKVRLVSLAHREKREIKVIQARLAWMA
jgi:hypothetical protein